MDVGRQNLGKIAILKRPPQPFHTKWTLDVKNWGKIATLKRPSQPFRTKWTLDVKNWGKIATLMRRAQPFRTKWTLDVKNWGKNCDFTLVTARPPACKGSILDLAASPLYSLNSASGGQVILAKVICLNAAQFFSMFF